MGTNHCDRYLSEPYAESDCHSYSNCHCYCYRYGYCDTYGDGNANCNADLSAAKGLLER